ncbi:ketopantoate reductase PanE/ApbA C terminal-domain-containing protein [Amylocarpus encephaloides]|uniref:2-dehydropantoate 2-reductase n=1 Tax=Amylocarpus encephaloides TaxID=45428 RepID=A0A9P8C3Q9_9HELO|nr:ketopantoate reductase PanE/ApbA C terminal-domain-containing protein [Amylocarpus encephaloides]
MMAPLAKAGRIHILGVGNLGRLFAHALAAQPNPPPITLLLHRESLQREWDSANRQISLTIDDIPQTSSNYAVELINHASPPQELISNLILTTKATKTYSAVSSIKSRLDESSTILFTQNGMGIIPMLTNSLFPDVSTRPSYLSSITSHGLYSTAPFTSVVAGRASMLVSPVDSPPKEPPSSHYLRNQVVSSDLLNAKAVTPEEFTLLQLEKLVINSILNPLTTLFRLKNGPLLTHPPILSLARLLLSEVSQILSLLPEIRSLDLSPSSQFLELDLAHRFSPEELEIRVLDVAERTAGNTSSMLQDAMAHKETEIEYINGYFVRRGREVGVDVHFNEMVVEMMEGCLGVLVERLY